MPDLQAALGGIPAGLKDELIKEFTKITQNYRENRWEATELDGGRLCEIAFTVLKGHIDGAFPATPSKPDRFKEACERLANANSQQFSRSVRLTLPRVLVALYDVRNQRGVGHVGGDVSANRMDATLVVEMSQWIMAELVRIFHQVDTVIASATVDALVERRVPIIWDVNGRKRVLDTNMTVRDKTLLLLYSEPEPTSEGLLVDWLERKRPSDYRRDVLRPLHKSKLIEYDERTRLAQLSPIGVGHVEQRLLTSS